MWLLLKQEYEYKLFPDVKDYDQFDEGEWDNEHSCGIGGQRSTLGTCSCLGRSHA